MKFKAKTVTWNKVEADAVVLFVSDSAWQKELLEVDRFLNHQLVKHLIIDAFKPKEGSIYAFPGLGRIGSPSIYIVSLGKKEQFSIEKLRHVTAKIGRYCHANHKKVIAVNLATDVLSFDSIQNVTKAVIEGIALGTYSYTKYKKEKDGDDNGIVEVQLLAPPARIQHVTNSLKETEIGVSATIFARDLINESPTKTTPTFLAQVAKSLAKKGEIKVEILEEKEIKKLGMDAFLAVSRGSDEAPKFIKLTYVGGRKKIFLAGKAITFDTGGLSLKDSKNMETMKLDMSGGAAVLGVFSVISQLKPKITVVGLIAACENMPGPSATKPGDIVSAMNGKTIEILNTDAEGRLTLADVLSYAVKEGADYIIDLATLTGACMVALGDEVAGLFSNNKELTEKIVDASRIEGEKVWELPLEKEYKESIKSNIADLRNISTTRYGGAITAALFLEEFVDGKPWAHLDIAGPAFEEKDTPLVPKGGAGFGVRTLLSLLKNF